MKHNILINRNFALLWTGKIISQIGDKFYALALAWWILQKTSSPGIMGMFLFLCVLPGLLLGLFAGALVDSLNRRKLLIITDILRGLLVLGVVLLSLLQILSVWQVFVIGAALSLVTAFFDPAAQAILVQLVDREALGRANSMNQMVSGLCTILGPILGATAISLFGVILVFAFNSVSYFISAILSTRIHLDMQSDKREKTFSILTSMKEGIFFLKSNRRLLRIIGIIASVHFLMGGLMVLMPFLANGLDGKGVQNLGYLETFLGIGLLTAALFISRKKNFPIRESILLITVLAIGICYLCISVLQLISINNIIPYLSALLLLGCTISTASVFWQSMIQLNTPPAMTGRVFSVAILAGNISLPIAYGLCGILLTFIPISVLVMICGSGLILLSVLLMLNKKSRLDTANTSSAY